MKRFPQAPGRCPWLLSLLPREHLTGVSGRRQPGHMLLQEAFSGALSGPESGGAEPFPPTATQGTRSPRPRPDSAAVPPQKCAWPGFRRSCMSVGPVLPPAGIAVSSLRLCFGWVLPPIFTELISSHAGRDHHGFTYPKLKYSSLFPDLLVAGHPADSSY